MTVDKLRKLEPLFGSWYVDEKIAQGKDSEFFRIYNSEKQFYGLKTVKFPRDNEQLSRIIESGKYKTVDEYLEKAEKTATQNISKMLTLQLNDNIVRFDSYQVVKESSCFYLVILTELLTPFDEYMKKVNVTKELILKLGSDIANAIDGFREIGVIHGNVTPDNIYVDSQGNFRLGDFGFSESGSSLYGENINFLPPEAMGTEPDMSDCDNYALGVLLYKLLNNNRFPYYPQTVTQDEIDIARIRRMQGESLCAPANADEHLARIITKALAFNPSDRYFSPLLMVAELDRYRDAQSYQELNRPLTPVAISNHTPEVKEKPVLKVAHTNSSASTQDVYFDSIDISGENAAGVTQKDKEDFRNAFVDDPEEEDKPDSKKIYFTALVVLLAIALVIGVVFVSLSGDDEPTTTDLTVSTTVAPTVTTTVPPTVTTAPTTTETTTESTTESTTETTTETTSETTTEATTETTTESTTETTAETTETTEADTQEVTLVSSDISSGTVSEDGRTYIAITDYEVIHKPEDIIFDEVVIDIYDTLSEDAAANGEVYIYEMQGSTVIQKVPATLSCIYAEDGDSASTVCFVTCNGEDFYYSPENFDYYVCFEEGAITSSSVITLPLQIKL